MIKEDIVWISWQHHRRTEQLCAYFSIKWVVITPKSRGVWRYLLAIKSTISELRNLSPRILIVQNPSLVLTGLAIVLAPFFRYKLIVDAHNEAVTPFINDNWLIRMVSNLMIKMSDFTIVTNECLASIVDTKGGTPVILPDKTPKVNECDLEPWSATDDRFKFLLIATYAPDEPVKEIISAAGRFADKLDIYVTGNYKKLDVSYLGTVPENVHFTGFLSDSDYFQTMLSSHAIVDLTLMDNCLVCGAYEGVAMSKPMILSNNAACIDYFDKGVVHTGHKVDEIGDAIKSMIDGYDALNLEIRKLKLEIEEKWKRYANAFSEVLGSLDTYNKNSV